MIFTIIFTIILSDKNIISLEQQILNLQSQLQQQLNLRTHQQLPNMMAAQPNMGMQMPNMVSPMVQGVDQQGNLLKKKLYF